MKGKSKNEVYELSNRGKLIAAISAVLFLLLPYYLVFHLRSEWWFWPVSLISFFAFVICIVASIPRDNENSD